MGKIEQPKPVLLIAAVTSRNADAFDWVIEQAESHWGPVALKSPIFDFTETSFYTESMGTDLKKQFLAFETLFDSGEIAQTKHVSNELENAYVSASDHPEQRPVNIDPGYITEAKLVLVTTKDPTIDLLATIYSEVTLFYRSKQWQHSRWTYPDYPRRLSRISSLNVGCISVKRFRLNAPASEVLLLMGEAQFSQARFKFRRVAVARPDQLP